MIFFRTPVNTDCFIDPSKVIGIEERKHIEPPRGCIIYLEGGGEITVRSSPKEVLKAIEAEVPESMKQIGWYNLNKGTFRTLLSKETKPGLLDYSIPVYIKGEQVIREKEQVGWYNPTAKRFCYMDEKECSTIKVNYTVPVFIAGKEKEKEQVGWYDGSTLCSMGAKELSPIANQRFTTPIFIER